MASAILVATDITWDSALNIILACAVLMSAVVVLYLGISIFRRRWLEEGNSTGQPWSLEDLRRMRAEGLISQQEFDTMRESMIRELKGEADGGVSPTPAETDWDWIADRTDNSNRSSDG